MQLEIDHLMEYIQNSECMFIRNGTEHNPEQAINHIIKKYMYYKKRITTTEEFIDFCASKSTLSHKSYKINCPGQPVIESKVWLLNELKIFRNQ